jgi:hypothetical protein
MAWKKLGPVLVFGVLAYAIYGLIWQKQSGWYSWFIKSAVGLVCKFAVEVKCSFLFFIKNYFMFVDGGGFVMMTPQLFINYRLQSVAHLPWRVFGYKAMNTFIDDLFAFVIKMPSLHRAACFRDGK